MTFLGAKPMAGFSIFAREARLEARIRAADRVITGEGRFDRQSLMGKGVGELVSLCNRLGVPCVVIAGSVPSGFQPRRQLAGLYALDQITSPGKALHEPSVWLSDAAARAAAASLLTEEQVRSGYHR
jgi:glycerate kinase